MKDREPARRGKIKYIYRLLVIFAVFVAALWYFSGHYLTIRAFENVTGETEMAESELPYLTMITQGFEINRLSGYTSNLDWALNRETITPIGKDASLTVRIYDNGMSARKLKYELYDVSNGSLLETKTISAFDEVSEGCRDANIKFTATLSEGTEYSVKFTLITSSSRRVYYYTRIKQYTKGYLEEKLNYVIWFRNSLIEKRNQFQIEKNLETKANADRTDFSHVTIDSNWTMVSWGSMQPRIVAETVPTITDFYEEHASIVLDYLVAADTGSGEQLMQVRETFRFLYTNIRTYLYTYDRVTETIYDVANTYLYANDLKLGITGDVDMQILTTSTYKYTGMVHNGELWLYDSPKNTMFRVFSFRSDTKENELAPEINDHNLHILNLDGNGNMDFVVYGYFSRGEYEGRVGIVIYHYNHEANRLTETAYIPVNTTYELLKGELKDLIYVNSHNILYIALFDTVYSYNMTTRQLSTVAENVPMEHSAYISEARTLIWQADADDSKSDRLMLLNLETGETGAWLAPDDNVMCLLGTTNENIIFGYGMKEDICRNADGTTTVPLYTVMVSDAKCNILKAYSEPNVYVTAAHVEDNVIMLDRVAKSSGSELSYYTIAQDGISNRVPKAQGAVSVVERTSDLGKTERYISFPNNITMKAIPEVETVPIALLTDDCTVRITAPDNVQEFYRTYSFGKVVLRTSNAADAISMADKDEGIGAVIDSKGRLVWERGVKSARTSLKITAEKAGSLSSLQACLKMIFKYEGYEVDTSKIDFNETDVLASIQKYLHLSGVSLRGITVDQMLYYVYKKRPVIAFVDSGKAILVTGYDSNYVEYIDPATGKSAKMAKDAATKQFEKMGFIFYCYVK